MVEDDIYVMMMEYWHNDDERLFTEWIFNERIIYRILFWYKKLIRRFPDNHCQVVDELKIIRRLAKKDECIIPIVKISKELHINYREFVWVVIGGKLHNTTH